MNEGIGWYTVLYVQLGQLHNIDKPHHFQLVSSSSVYQTIPRSGGGLLSGEVVDSLCWDGSAWIE